MYKSSRGRSAPLSEAEFLRAFEQSNLLTLKNCDLFTKGLTTGAGVSFTPARKSRGDYGAQSYYSGYVFKADSKLPLKAFQEGFQPSPLQMVQAGQSATSRYRMHGGVVTSLSAIAAGWLLVQNLGISIYVYLVDATSYSGMMEHKPNMPAAYRYLEQDQLQSCDVLYTHPIFNTDIIGCVWSTQFLRPELAAKNWPPRAALGPAKLSLAVNPKYDKGKEGAEEVARLFSIG